MEKYKAELCVHSAFGIPGRNRTANYALGERCYIHLTTETYMFMNKRVSQLNDIHPTGIKLAHKYYIITSSCKNTRFSFGLCCYLTNFNVKYYLLKFYQIQYE